MSRSIPVWRFLSLAALAMLPSLAHAHAVVGASGGFMHGLVHPLGGLDHVCAMLAVGLWAAQTGGHTRWVMPLTFVGVMAMGGMLPMLGISLPMVEQGIVLSVLLLGVMIAAAVRLSPVSSSVMVGMFALWHGYAHGAEVSGLAPEAGYVAGFLLMTALLHGTGIAAVLGMQRLAWIRSVRAVGASIALCGVYLSAV